MATSELHGHAAPDLTPELTPDKPERAEPGAAAPAAHRRRSTAPASVARRAATVPAFVLHQWDWSETSLIIDLFTRDQGRLAVVAKGAKRPNSQLRPVLMPFQRVLVGLGRGAGEGGSEVLNLRTADYAGNGQRLPPAQLISGFYLNELLLRLLARGDAHPVLFDAYADTLQALAGPDDEACLRAFELVLLRQMGVLPELNRDTTTQACIKPGRAYRLHGEAGLVVVDVSRTGDGEQQVLAGEHCLALEQALASGLMPALRAACQADLPALRQQLRATLVYHLGSPPLRTRQLMVSARRLLEGL